jgi:hypothetical protein
VTRVQNSEESSDDVRGQMHAIQEHEVEQLRELASLLELEMGFVQQYLNVLKEVKAEWDDVYVLSNIIWASSSRFTH